jgi:hypothetical protein
MSLPHAGQEILDNLDTRRDLEILRQRLSSLPT